MNRHALASLLVLAAAPLVGVALINHLAGHHDGEWLGTPALALLVVARWLVRKSKTEEPA